VIASQGEQKLNVRLVGENLLGANRFRERLGGFIVLEQQADEKLPVVAV
jgi:hypothetical protein